MQTIVDWDQVYHCMYGYGDQSYINASLITSGRNLIFRYKKSEGREWGFVWATMSDHGSEVFYAHFGEAGYIA